MAREKRHSSMRSVGSYGRYLVWCLALVLLVGFGACGGGSGTPPGDDPGPGDPPAVIGFDGEYASVRFQGENTPPANRTARSMLGVGNPAFGNVTLDEVWNSDGVISAYTQPFTYTLGTNRDLALDTADAGEPNLHGCLSTDGRLAGLFNARSNTWPNVGLLVRRSEIFGASINGLYDYVVFGHARSPSDVHFAMRGTFNFDSVAGTVFGIVDDLNVDTSVSLDLGTSESQPFTVSSEGIVAFEFPTVIGGDLALTGQMLSGGMVVAFSSAEDTGGNAALGFAVRRSSVSTAAFDGDYDFFAIHYLWQTGVQNVPYNALWVEGSANGAGTWNETKRVVNHAGIVSTNTATSTLTTGSVAPDGTFEFLGRIGALSPLGDFAVVGFFTDGQAPSVGFHVRR